MKIEFDRDEVEMLIADHVIDLLDLCDGEVVEVLFDSYLYKATAEIKKDTEPKEGGNDAGEMV